MASRDQGNAPETIRAQLQRIVECRDFDASECNRRFLQRVVEETLAERAERIKTNTLLRLYGPLEPWFDKTWRLGEIEVMK